MSYEFNPNKIAQCPFDPSHKIAYHKLTSHIIKCKKSHPELEKILITCPFNAVHLIHPKDREEHLENCIDKHRVLNKRPIEATRCDLTLPIYNNKNENNFDEDWDNETDIDILKPKTEPKTKLIEISENTQNSESTDLDEDKFSNGSKLNINNIETENSESSITDLNRPRRNLNIGRGIVIRQYESKKFKTGK